MRTERRGEEGRVDRGQRGGVRRGVCRPGPSTQGWVSWERVQR